MWRSDQALHLTGTSDVGDYLGGRAALQSQLWPVLFHEYLANVGLSLFGSSPAGIVALMLHRFNLPSQTPSVVVYLIFAPAVFAILLRFSRLYAARRPVMFWN
jgi:hypothetical protein